MAQMLSNIKLHSFKFREEQPNNEIEVEYTSVTLNGFNLFIGDNAQGKTRLFRTFQFIKELLTPNRKTISTFFFSTFIFEVNEGGKKHNITYELNIAPSNEGNNYSEKISKNKKIFLSTEDRKVLNEKTKKHLDNFFIPKNTPAIAAIDGPEFVTIRLIREFFIRMLFIDARQFNTFTFDANAQVLDPMCTNLSSIVLNWKNKQPEIFQELVEDFKRCFSIVEQIEFIPQSLFLNGVGMTVDMLALQEKGLNKKISLADWSNGLSRLLSILCLPKTSFIFDHGAYCPSVIFIDEIENGLDFKTLGFIVEYLNDYSDHMQVIVSSHSPSISEFIHPQSWQVVKRKGSKIKISKPSEVEANLDEELEIFRQKYWAFYTKHVSSSSSYEPE